MLKYYADGQTHYRYLMLGWVVIAPLSIVIYAVATMYSQHPWLYFVFTIFNYWFCRYTDMDDDQSSMTSSEGRAQRETKSVHPLIGFIGAIWNSWKVIYAYIAGLFGGHRSKFSHGWLIGTFFRALIYDTFVAMQIYQLAGIGVTHLGWEEPIYELYLDIWLIPFIITQLITWAIADTIHVVLDTEFAKNRFYTPIKDKEKRHG